MKSIGILAGGGNLPKVIIEEAKKLGYSVCVAGFKGHTDDETLSMADISECFPIGQFLKIIKFFHKHGIKEVCLAGTINKPKVMDFRPDWLAAKIIFSLKSKGDDALLRAIIEQLEKEDLNIVSAAKLVPSLLSPLGVLTKTQPNDYIKDNVNYALPITQSLGAFDIGQSMVVKDNIVLAVECVEGTDATIIRGGELGTHGDKPCILVKVFKEGQDARADLPTIGLKTIELLIEKKYAALVIEANKSIFFNREEAIALANKSNFVIWSINKDELLN